MIPTWRVSKSGRFPNWGQVMPFQDVFFLEKVSIEESISTMQEYGLQRFKTKLKRLFIWPIHKAPFAYSAFLFLVKSL